MDSKGKMIKSVNFIGITVLTLGIILFLLGFFENGYSLLTSIGIGTVIGAVFIFLIGMFFVATEEMLEKTKKGAPL
ncbi:hypothetical protein ACI7RC_14825 [Brevibacillus sp. B_LB10_24]|uniref:hypothetical protein n=1 Tax=Brevibacillus sp. B_LB10_24 TaxID=3380645 RepID=UPI0038B6E767